MIRKDGFVPINKQHAMDLIRQSGHSASGLSVLTGHSPSWLSSNLKIGSIHRDDLKTLKEAGCDLYPALTVIPNIYILKSDIGIVFKTILMYREGMSFNQIAEFLGIDRTTARRYTETWYDNRFGLSADLLRLTIKAMEEEDASHTERNTHHR